ncbi:MAG TPA: hypothetical protein VJ739_09030, partial [Gemmataceae bacterium]|nr:hypothetical protein [Gemmataceae bacterium]
YTDERHHLNVCITPKECSLPAEELVCLENGVRPLAEAVTDFPQANLDTEVIHHPRSGLYHVRGRLRVPGATLFASDYDRSAVPAFDRCMGKLVRRVDAYKEHPDRAAEEVAAREKTLNDQIVAPEDPAAGPLGRAAEAGDYMGFRNLLIHYEDWLRKRVGRWLQRDPKAEARLHRDFSIGDLVEEVYLNAFERFTDRPTAVPLHEWLDSLIDPSVQAMLRHPDEERDNAAMVRSLREAPLP